MSIFLAYIQSFWYSIIGGEIWQNKKFNRIVGSIGAFIGIIVFIAYIPQIIANLQGNKAQPFQPLSAAISCLIWVIYGWTKEPKRIGY